MNHLIIEALNECLREQNTELKAELASAKAVIEAVKSLRLISPEEVNNGEPFWVLPMALYEPIKEALAAYDARGK